jgi:hypothetical protein
VATILKGKLVSILGGKLSTIFWHFRRKTGNYFFSILGGKLSTIFWHFSRKTGNYFFSSLGGKMAVILILWENLNFLTKNKISRQKIEFSETISLINLKFPQKFEFPYENWNFP